MSLSDKKIAVIGLGYVGLPLAALCAKKDYQVVGLDSNRQTVASLAAGKCHIRDEVVEGLLADAIESSNFHVTSDSETISDCSIYLICVPTPVDDNHDPDLAPLESACRAVAPYLGADDLVVVESTVFPGTCEQIVLPLLRELAGELREDGHTLEFINFGGGLGIPYKSGDPEPPHPDDYARTVRSALDDLECRLVFEPGRMIAGNAGILVTRVIYQKQGADRRFTIVDAAMNDLIRPTLYDAHHDIWPVEESLCGAPCQTTDVVGPVCETGDYLALGRDLPAFGEGDLMAVLTAGAYGAVQSSTYNTRPLVPEVLVRDEDYAVVRPRPSYDDMLKLDRIPDWLGGT